MKNSIPVRKVTITEFVNSKDKSMRFKSFKELIKEGNVIDFYFVYSMAQEPSKRYKSNRIRKLDLYRKEITTMDNRIYNFLNQEDFAKK